MLLANDGAFVAQVLAVIVILGARTNAGDQAVMFTLADSALPSDVGANGSMVVGSFRNGGGFYWMPTTGVVFVGGKNASSVSRDGKTIVGTAFDQRMSQAAIWQRSAEWKVLGSVVPNAVPCDDLLSIAYDASADGKVVVGLAWNGCNFARAFRWEDSTGMVDLGSTVPGRSSRANGVSGDGRVVVGWQEHANRAPVRQRDGSTAAKRSLPAPPNSSVRRSPRRLTGRRSSGRSAVAVTRSIKARGVGLRRAASSACRHRVSGCRSNFSGRPTRSATMAG